METVKNRSWFCVRTLLEILFVSLLVFVAGALFVPKAKAQDNSEIWSDDLPLGNSKWMGSRDSDGQNLPMMRMDSTGNLEINIPKSGKAGKLMYLKTPIASWDSNGVNMSVGSIKEKVSSVTFKATPTPATDLLQYGLNVPAGTPTVSTIARLPATPTPGGSVTFYNSWTATLKIQAGGAATINGAGTNGTIAVATLVTVKCTATGTANWECRLGVNPTPAA